jgi:Inner membrane component of T3SS, cytoplasmic domain/zinc-ribbon domain
MRCIRCAHENEAGANFCSSCGSPLPDDETTASLALQEERHELEDELGDVLDNLPSGLGVLVVRRGPGAGSRYALEQESTTVGRHPDSDVFLDDITVSRRHAVVTRLDDGYDVKDAGSLNGTYVNHERVETTPLRQFDEIQIGRFVLTFVGGESTS